MAAVPEVAHYYHLAGTMLDIGSVIMPGNWGRIVRHYGWRHGRGIAEQVMEAARAARFPQLPSRLDCAFVFLSDVDARNFRLAQDGFHHHLLYRVSLVNPNAPLHVTDYRLTVPQGQFRTDWADVYWMRLDEHAAAIPGVDWAATGPQVREMLIMSPLRVEELLP